MEISAQGKRTACRCIHMSGCHNRQMLSLFRELRQFAAFHAINPSVPRLRSRDAAGSFASLPYQIRQTNSVIGIANQVQSREFAG